MRKWISLKKIVISFILAAAFILGSLFVNQNALKRTQIPISNKMLPSDTRVAPDASVTSTAKIHLAEDGEILTSTPRNPGSEPSLVTSLAKEIASNPSMRSTMAEIQKRRLAKNYIHLFENLKFSSEEREEFLQILAERDKLSTDIGLGAIGADFGSLQRKEAESKINAVVLEAEIKIKEILGGDASFEYYKQYEASMPERVSVRLASAAVRTASAPLSTEQESALISAMYTVRKQRQEFSAATSAEHTGAPEARLDAQSRQQINIQLQNDINKTIDEVLSADQAKAWREYYGKRNAVPPRSLNDWANELDSRKR